MFGVVVVVCLWHTAEFEQVQEVHDNASRMLVESAVSSVALQQGSCVVTSPTFCITIPLEIP